MNRIDLVNQAWGTHPVFLRSKTSHSVFTAREVLTGTFVTSNSFSKVKKIENAQTVSVKPVKTKTLSTQKATQKVVQKTTQKTKTKTKTKTKKTSNKITNLGLNMVIAVAIMVGASLFVPSVYYRFFPVEIKQVSAQATESKTKTRLGGNFDLETSVIIKNKTKPKTIINEQGEAVIAVKKYAPPIDDSLPKGDWLIIPRIGVESQLQTTPDYRDALDTGLWMAPDFGRPGDTENPTIIAGHRYGWDWWWKDDYWKNHSFYMLPDLEPGDTFEIISDQRKWVYEIYAGEEGSQISDYDADVILYTCKYLTGPARHFRYARLVNSGLVE